MFVLFLRILKRMKSRMNSKKLAQLVLSNSKILSKRSMVRLLFHTKLAIFFTKMLNMHRNQFKCLIIIGFSVLAANHLKLSFGKQKMT